MATSAKKQRAKRRRGRQRQTDKNQAQHRYLALGVAVIVIALVGYFTFQAIGGGHGASAVQADTGALESLSITDNQGHTAVEAAPVTDRETRYLGPPSDPATVALAEAGKLGQPTLLWFHADWCHICQRIKPEVIDLGEQYDGKVKIVRLNVDHGESRAAIGQYGVRATPTFVLFDANGQLRGNVPGWPGYQALTDAFDQLLASG